MENRGVHSELEGLERSRQEMSAELLNEDIILNILYRLPHETQLRLCLVSKSWLDMISNPHRLDSCYSIRLKSYQNLAATPTLLGFLYPKDALCIDWQPLASLEHSQHNPLPTLPKSTLSLFNKCIPYEEDHTNLKASSNGYLLCERVEPCDSDSCESDIWLPYPHYFYVFNPFTLQEVDLPLLQKQRGNPSVFFECSMLASPLALVHFTVLLIDFSRHSNHPGFDVKVFSSDDNLWTEFYIDMSLPISSLGSSPGVALKVTLNVRLLFWFCNNNDLLLVLDETREDYWTIELPNNNCKGYNYKALCVFENCLFYGVQNQNEKSIQVFVYHYSLWQLKDTVCLRELEEKCGEIMNVPPSKSEDNGDLVSSIVYKGFHPSNPYIIFFIFQGKLMSYDVKCQNLVLHTTDDTHLPISDRHWIPCERWPLPLSLPSIPQEYG